MSGAIEPQRSPRLASLANGPGLAVDVGGEVVGADSGLALSGSGHGDVDGAQLTLRDEPVDVRLRAAELAGCAGDGQDGWPVCDHRFPAGHSTSRRLRGRYCLGMHVAAPTR